MVEDFSQKDPLPPTVLPIEFFDEVPIDINVDLGKTVLSIRDLLELEKGSIIEIPKSAGDNIEIKARNVKLALGEIFVIEGSIGVRITEIVTDATEA